MTQRVAKIIVALTIVGSGLAGVLGGWTWAAGFLIGGAASYFNYRNLVRVVEGLGRPESTGRIGAFAWVLLRLILLAAGAFVIIRFTQINIIAAFAGLAVPVVAIILETILELTYAR